MDTARIDSQLRQQLQAEPMIEHQLLVRVEQVDQDAEEKLRSLGIKVRRRLQLVPTFAITATGQAALRLLDFAWVKHIEEDRLVHTM